jgi:hypothetical protein
MAKLYKHADGSYSDIGVASEEVVQKYNTFGAFMNKHEKDALEAAFRLSQELANAKSQKEARDIMQKFHDQAIAECDQEVGQEEEAFDDFDKKLVAANMAVTNARLSLQNASSLFNTTETAANDLKGTSQYGFGAIEGVATFGEGFFVKVVGSVAGKLREAGSGESPVSDGLGAGAQTSDYAAKGFAQTDLLTDNKGVIAAGEKAAGAFEQAGKVGDVVKIAADKPEFLDHFDGEDPLDDLDGQLDRIDAEIAKFKPGAVSDMTDGPGVKELQQRSKELRDEITGLKAAIAKLIQISADHNVRVMMKPGIKIANCIQQREVVQTFGK